MAERNCPSNRHNMFHPKGLAANKPPIIKEGGEEKQQGRDGLSPP